MKLKELIEKFEERKTIIGNYQGYAVWWEDVKKIFEQLDEPEKVKVPQFVADWIEYCKRTGVDLYNALDMGDLYFYNYANQKDDLKLKEFFETDTNQEIFARAWLDGYEIEEEKRYLVKIRATKHYIAKDGTGKIFFSLAYKERFTKKELEEAGFGWVFSCEGIEVEEVE
ncbi:DUF1642 domain-containing protein [uncultured Streptococcus sp.]|uniref:DUF1642 domain-containing protein n=1 Tax=uncultured Streptococcus sp. TaxID=83427 RepID=UPI002045484D|nr:DUF1642 domain-containing protein [uncultured Streptococcus sp.]DAY19841.1 MAG TPA: Protein of unknown function (DUF1642) [Caudoviricetes sp.]